MCQSPQSREVGTLNENQAAVLRWIGDGCPPGVMEGYAHRVSASALRGRELVSICGKGPTWRAELTERGRKQLDRLNDEIERGPRQQRTSAAETAAEPKQSARLKTEELVAEVLAAGGRLSLPDKTSQGGVNWRQRAYAAQRHGKVPAGHHLSVRRTGDEFEIELLEGDTGNELGADSLTVPTRLTKYHPVARRFRERLALHEVSRDALPRVSRIIHALANAAEERGHQVDCVESREDRYSRSDRSSAKEGQLVFSSGEHSVRVRIWEHGAGPRAPYERQMREWREDRERPVQLMRFARKPKPYDSGATGELELEVLGWSSRQSRWGDRKRWRLEDRLPQVLREIETLAAEAEERRILREREEAERERQWEAAMERAKDRLVRAHREDVLRKRVQAWRDAEQVRTYCDAVEARHGRDVIAADPDAARWLDLARKQADQAQELPRMPADPEITHEALKPFLDGWSPYGPRGW